MVYLYQAMFVKEKKVHREKILEMSVITVSVLRIIIIIVSYYTKYQNSAKTTSDLPTTGAGSNAEQLPEKRSVDKTNTNVE